MAPLDPVGWYRRNFPDGPSHDERCLKVLASIDSLHNLSIIGHDPAPMFPRPVEDWDEARRDIAMETGEYPTVRRSDGGFRACGTGVEVLYRASMSTFDCSRLTRLVIAAHEHHCRVEVAPHFVGYDEEDGTVDELVPQACFWIRVHPRQPDGRLFERHPGLDHLALLAGGEEQ